MAVVLGVLPQILVLPSKVAGDVSVSLERIRGRDADIIVPDIGQKDF